MKQRIFLAILSAIFLLSSCAIKQKSDEIITETNHSSDRQTEVYDFTFTDPQGNRMVYYICLTTYDAPLPQEELTLDTEALEAVFSPEDASLLKTLTIADHPAAYYQGTQWTYLCCTTSPQTTVVLQYDPNVLSDETAFQVIQSIFSGAVPR